MLFVSKALSFWQLRFDCDLKQSTIVLTHFVNWSRSLEVSSSPLAAFEFDLTMVSSPRIHWSSCGVSTEQYKKPEHFFFRSPTTGFRYILNTIQVFRSFQHTVPHTLLRMQPKNMFSVCLLGAAVTALPGGSKHGSGKGNRPIFVDANVRFPALTDPSQLWLMARTVRRPTSSSSVRRPD